MRLAVAPSRRLPTAVAWNPDVLSLVDYETTYAEDLHHGYCAPRFTLPGLHVPLVAISAHLTPYSAQAAAQEAQLLNARTYRHSGVAVIAGDINHVPLSDLEPDWTLVQPYNRASRCRRRKSVDEPWQSDPIVGEVLRDADFVDVVAAGPTGKAGLVRVDQAHVTPALTPAIADYWVVDPGSCSDHYGIAIKLDLEHVDQARVPEYT